MLTHLRRALTTAVAVAGIAGLLVISTRASAQSVHNLERNLPLEVQDTAPLDTGKVSLQAAAVNETSETQDKLTLQPSVQWGFAENAHVQATAPFYVTDTDDARRGSGDVYLGLQYNFLAEGNVTPSLAAIVEVVAPTGIGSSGFDTQLTLIATKQITKEPSEDRLHLNVLWYHNDDPAADERENRFELVVGYSRKVSDKFVLVVDFFHRQEMEEGEESSVMEIGFLYQLSPRNTLGASVGTGIGEDSPDLRMGLYFQTILGS